MKGKYFLPKDSGIVIRKTLILHLITQKEGEDHCEFFKIKWDFSKITKEIISDKEKLAKKISDNNENFFI